MFGFRVMKMTGYKTCLLYRALKLHFTSDYDFFKYNGKVKKYTVQDYQNNKHKFVYDKIGTKYSDKDMVYFFVSNFLKKESVWVQELLEPEAYDNFVELNKKHQSLFYYFESDTFKLFSDYNHKELFKCNGDDLPLLLKNMLRGEVNIETVVIMNKFMKFIPKWEQNIKDEFIWPHLKNKLIKYEPFLHYDKSKFKNTLINCIEEFANKGK